jgi:hypothetical protein
MVKMFCDMAPCALSWSPPKQARSSRNIIASAQKFEFLIVNGIVGGMKKSRWVVEARATGREASDSPNHTEATEVTLYQ